MEVPAIWTDRWISRKTAVLSSFDLHLSRPDLHPMDMAAMPLWKSSLGQLYEYVFTDRFDIWDQSLCQYVLPGGGGELEEIFFLVGCRGGGVANLV